MRNLNFLPFPLPPSEMGTVGDHVGRSWTEDSPPWAQKTSGTFGADSGSWTMTIKIDGSLENVRQAIKYIVGFSQVWPIVDLTSPTVQGPYRLSRQTPARHPGFPNLRCTRILSAAGVGKRNKPGQGALIAAPPPTPPYTWPGGIEPSGPPGGPIAGTFGEWAFCYLTLLFEIPKYPMLNDDENSYLGGGHTPDTITPRPEYRRYTEFFPDEAMETIARKGETWSFLDPAARLIDQTFPGDRLLRQAKGSLKVVTYDVAQDFVFLGRFIPTNGLMALATLNSRPFPDDAYPDQNRPSDFARYRPGALLCMPSRYTSHAQCHPAVMQKLIDINVFPRTVDVERNFLFFDPPSTDITTVDLSSVGGSETTLIRGHNLCPLSRPTAATPPARGQSWFAAIKYKFDEIKWGVTAPETITAIQNLVMLKRTQVAMEELLYMYSDFEWLWRAPRSMPTP